MLREKRADVPLEVEAIYRRMLAKNPDDRYQSMQEVVDAFEAFRSGEAPSAAAESGLLMFDPTNERQIRKVCRVLFTDFKNYFTDYDRETQVENTLDERVYLYTRLLAVRESIALAVREAQEKAAQGEAGADSD